jgi:PAS domain S-box-containing protein
MGGDERFAAYEAIPDPVVVVGPDGACVYASERARAAGLADGPAGDEVSRDGKTFQIDRGSLARPEATYEVRRYRDVTGERGAAFRHLQILDALEEMVFTRSPGSVVTFANRAAERHYNLSRAELRGRTDAPFDRMDATREDLQDELEVFRTGKTVERAAEPSRRHDGVVRLFHTRTSPLYDTQGNVVEIVGVARDVTDERRLVEAAADQQRRLELALDAGRMGIWEWRIREQKVIWSEAIERMHGLAPGSFDGSFEMYQSDMHPDDRPRVLAAIQETVAARRDHALLYRIVRPDGEVRWLEAFGRMVLGDDGEPVRLVGVCSDVTDRIAGEHSRADLRAAEARRVEAEEARRRTQRILEGITDSFTVYDRDFRILFANEAAGRPLGKRPEELVGQRAWELVPDLEGSPLHRELERAMRDNVTVTVQDHYAPLDLSFELSAYPLGDGGLAVYSRDVTARRRQQALEERMARYGALRAEVGAFMARELDLRAMLQAVCEGLVRHLGLAFARVWLLDGSGEVLELHASAGLYTHLDGGHARVRVGDFKIGKIAAERKAHLTNDVQHDPRVGDKAWAVREGLVSFAGYPLVVDDNLVGVLAAFSRERLAEDTLNAMGSVSDAVAQGVVRRKTELELEERARDLARSNADLEQFAYVASHDLQEPLRMVASYTQLLARRYKGKLDQDADDFIGFAVEGVTRMQRLINDLLAYSRVGTRGREPQPVELEKVMAGARANLATAIAETGAEVSHDPLPGVLGDEGQLVQVLQNLVGNAIKFHREGTPPRVHVGVRREGGDWQISVRDNGIGIEPAYFERIFVIFQRLNPRERYPGTGIGLAITKKIIERHGGRIWVESTPGEGSTISFTLPATTTRARRLLP